MAYKKTHLRHFCYFDFEGVEREPNSTRALGFPKEKMLDLSWLKANDVFYGKYLEHINDDTIITTTIKIVKDNEKKIVVKRLQVK
jgi:hypothetical protein